MPQAFDDLLGMRRQRVEQCLRELLQASSPSAELGAAMRYAVLGGGKRLRPQLAYAAAEALGGHHEAADIPAAAVELIHAYSLIHDDLPAMDDDLLRRGRPTCHVVFGEAAAILAGDALQALAFEVLASSPRLSCGHGTRLKMLTELARASGWQGMVGGQAIDITAAGAFLDEAALGAMHGMKTGALIRASVLTGAMSTNLAGAGELERLQRYAVLAGLAFQVRDDILDVEASSSESGKQQGKDALLGKPTYPSMLGMHGAKARLTELLDAALATLDEFDWQAEHLRKLTRLLVERRA